MRLIDLSHPLGENTPVYPGDEPVRLRQARVLSRDHYNAAVLCSGMHAGTHVDLPAHLTEDTRTAADFSLDAFAGRGVLLDARGEELLSMKARYQNLNLRGAVALLYTGWDARYGQADYFTAHPAVSEALADFLLRSGIAMLGMDMPSPDYSPFPIHKALLGRDIPVLENLCGLSQLVAIPSFTVLALPLKIEAEASLVRAVCLVP